MFIYKSRALGPSISQDDDVTENDVDYRVRTYADGTIVWYLRGQFLIHRECGAAITYLHGQKVWFYYGTKIDCSSQEEYERYLNLKAFW